MLKIYSVIEGDAFNANKKQVKDAGFAAFGFGAIGKISYKRELSGEEHALSRFANLSKETCATLISGAITDNYGVLKKSVVVCEKGKLIGICDATLFENEKGFSGGGAFKVYQLSNLKLGVLVANDLINAEGVKAMSLCDADVIVCITDCEEKPQHNFLVRAYAYLYGVPFYLLTKNSVIASDIYGEIVGKCQQNTLNIIIPTKKHYNVVKLKRRGVKD